MKTKTNKSISSKKEKNYPAYYLAVIVGAVILLEGFLLGVAAPNDWAEGLEILDISTDVQVVVADLMDITTPMWEQYQYVNNFYQLAADEVIVMFDVSENDPLAFFRGVNEFYRVASIEMENILDMSGDLEFVGQVAGASIVR